MIYLINPFITSNERYGKDIGDIGGHQMPLGIYYLAAQLKKDGLPVDVLDGETEHLTHEDVVNKLKSNDVKIVGITSTTVAFHRARSLAEIIRTHLKDVTIVIGGPHMTSLPMETMKTNAFDYGIVHEGELCFSMLCRHLMHGEWSISDIPSLYYFDNGKIVSNPVGNYIPDLDTIPFPARELCPDLGVYKPPVGQFMKQPVMSLITSRGCPYLCNFCDNNTFGRKIRFASAEHVVAELKEMIDVYGAREIAFLDDTFIIHKKRLYKIFELLNEEGISFPWTCMTRANNLTEEIVKMIADNGCWQLRIGVESGNQDVLDFMKKGITLEQVKNAAHWCDKYGIKTTGFFMIGHHTDTPETVQQTIDFALSLPFTDITVTINTPMPGTESYNIAHDYGEYSEGDWTSLNYWTPVFVPKGLTAELMKAKQAEMYRRFYTQPRVILNQIKKIKSLSELKVFLKNAILGLKYTKESKAS